MFHRMFHRMFAGLLPTFRTVPSNRMPSHIRHVSQLPSSIWIITAAPSSSSQHNTAQQLHAVSNGHLGQPPCLPTVSPYHRVSHKCRWHPSPPWSSRSCPAVGHSHPPKPTHDDEHRTAAFASRPSLRILSRDLSLVLHHLPSRLSRATLASALSSVSATCLLAAARTWRPRWRARSRTVAARVFCIDAAVAEVVFTPPFRRLPRGPCWAHHP